MPLAETPKRLPPTRDTLRELYLKSGNRCAFPGCKKHLFNIKGVFVGQICHIEAAEPGGERFNINQTNEQRRLPSNLMLMCYDHHVETNDVGKFPLERLARIKAEHEKIYSDVVGAMLISVKDHTTLTEPLVPRNLNKLADCCNWKMSAEEHTVALAEAISLVKKLAKVPIPSREIFLIVLNRSEKGQYGADRQTSVAEIQQATNLSSDDLRACFSILDKHGFTHDNGRNDFGIQMVGVTCAPSGWTFWGDLKKFCNIQGIELAQAIVNLDFTIVER
jgi:hypothetical protein